MLSAGYPFKTAVITILLTCGVLLPYLAIASGGSLPSSSDQAPGCSTYHVSAAPPMYYGRFLMDRMEYAFTGQDDKLISYEATGWYGGDYQRAYLEVEGSHDSGNSGGGEMEKLDILYGKLISPWWTIRAGTGYKGTYGPQSEERFFGVVGLKGLAPFLFEVDTNARVSNRGEVLLDMEAEYDMYLTQRLVLQPRMDATFSFNRIEGLGIGPGFSNLGFSARLRYEIRRQLAPYVGISWSTRTGGSRDMARQEEEPRDVTAFMAGIRIWF